MADNKLKKKTIISGSGQSSAKVSNATIMFVQYSCQTGFELEKTCQTKIVKQNSPAGTFINYIANFQDRRQDT